MMPNRLVWAPDAVAELDAALLSDGPDDVDWLVRMLENRPPPTGWSRTDQDEVLVLYGRELHAVYQLIGAGTTIEVLEVRRYE
ncbi:hypothetical protein AB0F43_25850 [Kribbella sp. NPDC023972]|uniref:hypothetical protein n=1 Tax=Kribbella sp. NPDC023972 TaxID=3154795 RepID=UPI0033D9EFCF